MQVADLPMARSSHNPFRSPVEPSNVSGPSTHTDLEISPSALEREPATPTGEHSRSPSPDTTSPVGQPDAPAPPQTSSTQRIYDPPPGPPPGPAPVPPPSAAPALEAAIAEELPPAYTPTADIRHGETSIEFGPRRPFGTTSTRQQQQQQQQQQQRSQRPSWQPLTNGARASPGRGVYTVRGSSSLRRLPPGAPLINIAPPPQHPALPSRGPPQRPVSEFARDFYSAGAGEGGAAASGSQDRPPPMPPRPTNGNGSEGQQEIPDDGRPTNKPVPGHPLLNSGKVLVYPADYECSKCHNTGYKHYDPSNPCTKCWTKYAKAYAGPLTYAPWMPASGVSPTESNAGHNLQRPLPNTRSPTSLSHQYSHSLTDLTAPPAHPDLGRSSSTSRQYGNYSGAYARAQPSSSGWPPASWSTSPSAQYTTAPPPGATVVHPGDPRIGGRLCWRCGGRGVTSFMIFDEQTCQVCSGLGRTF